MREFSCLADVTRLAIVELLARQGATASSSIATHFTLTPSAISQHLKALAEAGLLRCERRGQQRIYALDPNGLGQIAAWLDRTNWFFEQSKGEGGMSV